MDTLDNRQSAFLKRIAANPAPYDTLTKEEKEICVFLTKQEYITYQTETKKRSFNGVFQVYDEITVVSISEKGKMYLVNEQLSNEQHRYLKEQMDSLRELADSAKKQANIAIENAKNAEKESAFARRDACFAKITSIITILISIVAIIVSAVC